MIFTKAHTPVSGGMPHDMSAYDYLNRSDRPIAQSLRDLVDDMHSRYPENHRTALAVRLQSNDDNAHHAAFFELVVHELLNRNNYVIQEVEPNVPEVQTRPDFLVRDKSGQQFYVEATIATGQSIAQKKKLQALNKVYAALDELDFPPFRIWLRGLTLPSESFSKRKLQSAVRRTLEDLYKEKQPLPRPEVCNVQVGELQLRLRVTADSCETNSSASQTHERGLSGIFLGGGYAGPSVEDLSRKLREKAHRYGSAHQKPFFIALNEISNISHHSTFNPESLISAVYGKPVYELSSDMEEVICKRHFNGVLLKRRGPEYRRVSGIICFQNVTPWSLATSKAFLVVHPCARRPYGLKLGLPILEHGEDEFQSDVPSIAELLGVEHIYQQK